MLRVESKGPVLHVTLNRPEVRNAFNDALIAALDDTFARLPEGTRVVILSGEGKAFCAGGDLNWMAQAASYTEEQNYQDAMRLAGQFERIATCPAVTIAKVHGAVYGGGCGLVAAVDIAAAAEGTRFAFSEVRLGLIPATITRYVIPKIGAGHARALFATGEAFDATHAVHIGLVHLVAPAELLDGLIDAKIEAVLASGPDAVATSKRLVLGGPMSGEESARCLARARAGDEGKEGVAAFLEKRPPSFAVKR